MSTIGPVQALVLEAWGLGIRIDTDAPAQQARLVDLLDRARQFDAMHDNDTRDAFGEPEQP